MTFKPGDLVSLDGFMTLKVEAVKGDLLECRSPDSGIPFKVEASRVAKLEAPPPAPKRKNPSKAAR